MAQTPTAEALKSAREARALAKTNYDGVAAKLGTPDWKEDTDGPLLDTEKRNFDNAQTLVDRLTDKLETEARSANGGNPITANVIPTRTKDADLPKKFSLHRAIRIQAGITDARGNTEKRDGIEHEMMEEGVLEARNAEITEFTPGGFVVPSMCAYKKRTANPEMEVRMLLEELERRDMTVGTTTAGGHMVATDLGDLIPFLDPDTPLARLGARRITGLVGNLDLPRWAARSTGYAVAEQGSITESTPTLAKLSLTPKRQGAYVESSLQLLRQSSTDVENITRGDLRTVLMQLQEQYAIQGTGSSNQPTGITATSGIGSVAGGTNGLVPAWSHITALEYEVAVDNALRGKLGYLITPGVANVLKNVKRDVAGNGFILEGPNNGGGLVNGYPVATSTLVPSTLTKGSASGICHALIFGNFQELMMCYWGGVEIVFDPYSLATTGSVRITANAFFDVGVRHAQSFSAMLDALLS